MTPVIVEFGNVFGFSLRVYGYGLMLVLGFLLGIALTQWRARRAGESPDVIARCGLLAVLGGIAGARIAYVIQHHDKLVGPGHGAFEVFDITSGGLTYYGGLILAVLMVTVYLAAKKLPVRRYLDCFAVSIMIGLAFGRAGCLLNGCCYGAEAGEHSALGMTFPMYAKPLLKLDSSNGPYSSSTEGPSPVFDSQFTRGLIHPDARLVYPLERTAGPLQPLDQKKTVLIPRQMHGKLDNDQVGIMLGSREAAKAEFDKLTGPSGLLTHQKWNATLAEHGQGFLRGSELWEEAVYLYDTDRDGRLSFEEAWAYLQGRLARVTRDKAGNKNFSGTLNDYLQADLFALAGREHSLPVKPSQAIGIVNALVLAGVLAIFYRLRRREGQAFALLAILYPITRFLEELIRDDNQHDLVNGILTHNQYTSIALLIAGVTMWIVLRHVPASAGPAWNARLALAGLSNGRAADRGGKSGKLQKARNGQRS